MKTLFIMLSLAFIAIPAWGQSPAWSRTNAEILCGNNLPDVRIKMCTSLIQLTGEAAPRLAAIYYNRDLAYWQKSLNDLAFDDFTNAIYLNPRFAYAYVARGEIYGKKGIYDQAIADYAKAIELNPNDAHVYNNIAWAYHEKNEDAQGLAYAEKAVAMGPHDTPTA
jgi:tetratricopeptide (TPR) repeat protein